MNGAGLYSFIADTILVIHFAFVVFVVFGFMLILIASRLDCVMAELVNAVVYSQYLGATNMSGT